MSTVADLMKKVNKSYGEGVLQVGVQMQDVERIPTGIFALDLSLGGGFPRGKMSEIYGPESSGKTNTALKAIASFQKLYPNEKVAFVDAEHSFDATWANLLGVQTDKILLVSPTFAEQAVDIIEGLLLAEDVGLVVLDSIAAMVTNAEIEKSSEGKVMGGNSALIGIMIKKALISMASASAAGRYPTFILINQIRFKIGVMYGNPETTPGGNGPKFHAAIRMRCYGKNIMENAISKTMPAWKETSTVIQKWKVPIVSVNSIFRMATIPMEGVPIGHCDDWNTVFSYAKNFGLIAKGKNSWLFNDLEFKTIQEMKAYIDSDPMMGMDLRKNLIQMAVCDSSGVAEEFSGTLPPVENTDET